MGDATVSSKGQIVIPKAIRSRLHLKAGDRLRFLVAEDGTVRLSPVTRDISTLKDLLPRPDERATLQQMKAAVRRRAARRAGKP